MASIEPISSAMTFQAQNTQITRPATKNEAVDMEVASQETSIDFDPATAKIVEANESDTKGQSQSEDKSMYESQREISQEQIKKAVENINKNMSNSEAVFGIHDETNRVTIKIVDKDTKKVIKELPPEKTLDMIAKAWELAGLLVDERR